MTYLDIEAKRLAILSNLATHQVSIEQIKKQILNTTSISFDTALDLSKEIELYMIVINSMQSIVNSELLGERATTLLQAVEDKFEILNKRIRTSVYEKIKTAKLADRSSGDLANTYNIDISKQSFAEDETTSVIEGGKILGVTSEGNGNVTLVTTEWLRSITPQIDDGFLNVYGSIAKRITTGWTVASNEEILNVNGDYLVKCEASKGGNKKITIDIDLGRGIDIESICPVFDRPEVLKIYTSVDNIGFNLLTNKTVSVDTTFTTPRVLARYIKIVVFKDKESYKYGSKYVYEIKLKQIKISHEYEKKDTQFVTKAISVNKNVSKISIDADDSLQLSEYYISVNDKEWRQIRPIGWDKNRDVPSVLKVQEVFENKLIELTNPTLDNGSYTYDLNIPQAFTISNKIKLFGGVNNWTYEEDRYSAFILNYEDININISTKEIYINNKIETGNVTIGKGLNKIGIKREDFKRLFNKDLISSYKIDGANIEITLRDGTTSTVVDTMYPYNLKLLIEENADFVFAKEISEGNGYKLIRNDTSVKVSTKEKEEALYCVFYNLYTLVNSIKIKGIIKSNNTTISETSRITLRVA